MKNLVFKFGTIMFIAIIIFGIIVMISGFFVPNFQEHNGTVVDKWKDNHGFTLILNESGIINKYSVSTDDYYKATINNNITINVPDLEGFSISICGMIIIALGLLFYGMISSLERDPWRY